MLLEDAKALARHAFTSGRMAHAYLLVGSPRGVAAEMAVFMMQMLACQEKDAPCGQCDVCRHIAARTWCDNLWVYPMKKSRVISVDQMRHGSGDNKLPPPYLLPWLSESSFAGGWKAAVLAGADRLNDAAANAFLKMLEEPPPRTLLLLLTDAPQLLLPTIRSRCQQIDLSEPPRELPDPWYGQVLSILANGNQAGPLAATSMSMRLQSVLTSMRQAAEKAAEEDLDEETGIEVESEEQDARISALYRESRSLLVLTLQRWFRDLLVLRAGGAPSTVHYQAYIDTLSERARRITLAQALANIDGIDSLSRQLERSIPESTAFPYWLDRMAMGAPLP